MTEPVDVINAFNAAIEAGDLDAILACFTTDATYHNIPMAAVSGHDAIRATLESFMSPGTKVSFIVNNQVGKIAAWRDYFDLNMFMSQLG